MKYISALVGNSPRSKWISIQNLETEVSYAQLGTAARLRGALLGRDRPNHFGLLSLVVYIMGSGQVSDLLGGNKTLPPP